MAPTKQRGGRRATEWERTVPTVGRRHRARTLGVGGRGETVAPKKQRYCRRSPDKGRALCAAPPLCWYSFVLRRYSVDVP